MTNYILEAIREVDETPDGLSIEMQMNFSRIVLKRIKELELTQRKLAQRAGKFESYISRVLNGDENISIKRMAEILFALNKTRIEFRVLDADQKAATPLLRGVPIERATDDQGISFELLYEDSYSDQKAKIRLNTIATEDCTKHFAFA